MMMMAPNQADVNRRFRYEAGGTLLSRIQRGREVVKRRIERLRCAQDRVEIEQCDEQPTDCGQGIPVSRKTAENFQELDEQERSDLLHAATVDAIATRSVESAAPNVARAVSSGMRSDQTRLVEQPRCEESESVEPDQPRLANANCPYTELGQW